MSALTPRLRALGVAALAAAVAGCGASPAGRPDYPLLSDETDPAAAAVARHERPHQGDPPARAAVPRRRAGAIVRAELDAVLDAGPARFLAGLRLSADVDGRRFRGWRIDAFFPDDDRFAAVDLQPGDVILRVNGRVIVRPEHFQDVWDGLRDAAALVIEVRRPTPAGAPPAGGADGADDGAAGDAAGERFLLDYAIVDSPPVPGDKIGP